MNLKPKTKPRPKLRRIRYQQLHVEFLKYFEDAAGNAGERFLIALQQLEVLRSTAMPVRYKCTFWNKDLEKLKRQRNKARNRKQAKKYHKLRADFRKAFKQAKTKDYLQRLREASSLPNPWKAMKLLVPSLRKRKKRPVGLPTEAQSIVNSLAEQYAVLMTTELEDTKEDTQRMHKNAVIHPWEIQTVLKSSNHSSTPGHDGISYRHIFKLSQNLAIMSALTAAVNQWVFHGLPASFNSCP